MKGRSLTRCNRVRKILKKYSEIPGNYLEIGCYDGVNLCEVAEDNPERICYGLDPFISDGNTGQEFGVELPNVKECPEFGEGVRLVNHA